MTKLAIQLAAQALPAKNRKAGNTLFAVLALIALIAFIAAAAMQYLEMQSLNDGSL